MARQILIIAAASAVYLWIFLGVPARGHTTHDDLVLIGKVYSLVIMFALFLLRTWWWGVTWWAIRSFFHFLHYGSLDNWNEPKPKPKRKRE